MKGETFTAAFLGAFFGTCVALYLANGFRQWKIERRRWKEHCKTLVEFNRAVLLGTPANSDFAKLCAEEIRDYTKRANSWFPEEVSDDDAIEDQRLKRQTQDLRNRHFDVDSDETDQQ